MFGRDSEDEICSRFVFEFVIWPQEVTLVRWTQSSGPLCLWQCFYYCHVMFFHSRSRSREFLGMIASDSHSRIVGMDFFHSLPVPELWEWIFFIPFPFPNLLFHRRESKRELDYCKRYQASNFFSFLYISQNNYIEEVNWAKMFKSEWLKRQDILLSFVANSFAAKVLVIVN